MIARKRLVKLCMVTMIISLVLLALFVFFFVVIFVPAMLRARELGKRNACWENQSKLELAIQQYITDHDLTGVAADDGRGLLDHLGNTEQGEDTLQTWLTANDPAGGRVVLVGDRELIRWTPVCPAGGLYRIQDQDSADAVGSHSVHCNLAERRGANRRIPHIFPPR